jgi:hypothetical protein
MKNSKKIIVVILSLFFHSQLFSTPADTTSIIDNIYNYEFVIASEKLSRLNEKDLLLSKTLSLEIKWWMAIEKGDKDHFSEFMSALNQFEKTTDNDLSVVVSSTYRMRYYACTNKSCMIPFLFLKIQNRINKVDSSVSANSGSDGNELFILYKSFLTLVRDSYLNDILLSDSKRKQELITEIERVISNGSSSGRTIGRYFLMKYYYDIEKDKPKAFTYLSELHDQYPNNLIFAQLLTK